MGMHRHTHSSSWSSKRWIRRTASDSRLQGPVGRRAIARAPAAAGKTARRPAASRQGRADGTRQIKRRETGSRPIPAHSTRRQHPSDPVSGPVPARALEHHPASRLASRQAARPPGLARRSAPLSLRPNGRSARSRRALCHPCPRLTSRWSSASSGPSRSGYVLRSLTGLRHRRRRRSLGALSAFAIRPRRSPLLPVLPAQDLRRALEVEASAISQMQLTILRQLAKLEVGHAASLARAGYGRKRSGLSLSLSLFAFSASAAPARRARGTSATRAAASRRRWRRSSWR